MIGIIEGTQLGKLTFKDLQTLQDLLGCQIRAQIVKGKNVILFLPREKVILNNGVETYD